MPDAEAPFRTEREPSRTSSPPVSEHLEGALASELDRVLAFAGSPEPGERVPGQRLERPNGHDVERLSSRPSDGDLHLVEHLRRETEPSEVAERVVHLGRLAQIAIEALVDEHVGDMAEQIHAA